MNATIWSFQIAPIGGSLSGFQMEMLGGARKHVTRDATADDAPLGRFRGSAGSRDTAA